MLGVIDVDEHSVVIEEGELGIRILAVAQRVYDCEAETADIRDLWVSCIQHVIDGMTSVEDADTGVMTVVLTSSLAVLHIVGWAHTD
jgi:hypothetical protein